MEYLLVSTIPSREDHSKRYEAERLVNRKKVTHQRLDMGNKAAWSPNWQRAWIVDVANGYAGHISGLRVGFTGDPEAAEGWDCYAINCPHTVAADLPRLCKQARTLFLEAWLRGNKRNESAEATLFDAYS